MKASEESIDKRIEKIMSEGAIEQAPSQKFTSQVMVQVSEIALEQTKAAERRKQILLGTLGFIALGVIATTLFFLWSNGFIHPIINQVSNFILTVFSKLPLTISPWLVGGVVLHLMLFRGVMAIYLVNKQRKILVRI